MKEFISRGRTVHSKVAQIAHEKGFSLHFIYQTGELHSGEMLPSGFGGGLTYCMDLRPLEAWNLAPTLGKTKKKTPPSVIVVHM